jgi:hypothetical protein
MGQREHAANKRKIRVQQRDAADSVGFGLRESMRPLEGSQQDTHARCM